MQELRYLTTEEVAALQRWHKGLQDHRGNRARLRRAERAEDVLLTSAFFDFLCEMPENWGEEKRIFTSAAVSGLLAHATEDRRVESKRYQPKADKKEKKIASFAELLARPIKGQKQVPMSEIRFQRLQQSRTTDDFYRGIRRAIRLLGDSVNIASLANDIIQWHFEFNGQSYRNPTKRLAVRWATDYFTVLPKNK